MSLSSPGKLFPQLGGDLFPHYPVGLYHHVTRVELIPRYPLAVVELPRPGVLRTILQSH